MQREAQAARAETARVAQLQRQVTEARGAIEKANAEVAARNKLKEILAGRRAAFPALLRAISEKTTAEIVIRRIIESGDGRVVVQGTGWGAASADAFADGLEQALEETPWELRPLHRRAQGVSAALGPWNFALQLTINDEWTALQPVAAVIGEDYGWP